MSEMQKCVVCNRKATWMARASVRKDWEAVCPVHACTLPARYELKEVEKKKDVSLIIRTCAYKRRYYEKKRDEIIAAHRRYYTQNKEYFRRKYREWAQKNPVKVSEFSRLHYARNKARAAAVGMSVSTFLRLPREARKALLAQVKYEDS